MRDVAEALRVLRVQLHSEVNIAGIPARQPHDVFRLRSGGDAMGHDVRFIGVHRQQAGDLGDGCLGVGN
jgi:hypothetical protein